MNRTMLWRTALILPAAVLTACSPAPNPQAAARPSRAQEAAAPGVLVASAGRVEGASDTIEVGASVSGVVKTVSVSEGQAVRTGEPLAEMDCADLRASLRAAMSEADGVRQVRARLLRGSREEERQMAAERTTAARADRQRAAANLERMRSLFGHDEISRSQLDDARRDAEVADATLEQAIHHEKLVNAPPLPEEVAKADADVVAAQNRVGALREQVAKCVVTAPANGTILRLLIRPGESFSLQTPRPLLTMADLSVRRVRAEVDERDVPSVRVGQQVLVFSDAAPETKYRGAVDRLADTMGRKKILRGDPADRADRDVLEAMITLERAAQKLPVGMRVVVQFLK